MYHRLFRYLSFLNFHTIANSTAQQIAQPVKKPSHPYRSTSAPAVPSLPSSSSRSGKASSSVFHPIFYPQPRPTTTLNSPRRHLPHRPPHPPTTPLEIPRIPPPPAPHDPLPTLPPRLLENHHPILVANPLPTPRQVSIPATTIYRLLVQISATARMGWGLSGGVFGFARGGV